MHRPGPLLLASCLAFGGCAGPSIPPPPAYDPETAVGQVFSALDANKDGLLEDGELATCPGLRLGLANIDTNKDRRISREELLARFEKYAAGGVSLRTLDCVVTQGGKPLAEATVTFAPEPFLGPDLKPASAVTDAQGAARPGIEGVGAPGVPLGIYRVSVSKKDGSGRETVPAKFNTNTTLGREVGPDERGTYSIQLP